MPLPKLIRPLPRRKRRTARESRREIAAILTQPGGHEWADGYIARVVGTSSQYVQQERKRLGLPRPWLVKTMRGEQVVWIDAEACSEAKVEALGRARKT